MKSGKRKSGKAERLKNARAFRALVKEQAQRGETLAALQLWGDFPDHTARNAISQDWQHVLMSQLTDVFEQVRLDESDPLVVGILLKDLARLVATCEAWAAELEAE